MELKSHFGDYPGRSGDRLTTPGRSAQRVLPPYVGPNIALSLLSVASVILMAIGVSGVLAGVLGAAFSKEFISGDSPGVVYTAERCGDFFEYHPEAADCLSAATAHHFDEVLSFRLASGALGVMVLAAYVGFRWRFRRFAGAGALPSGFTSTVGASLFGVVAISQLGIFAMQAAFGSASGTGVLLSGGAVSLAVLAGYAAHLARDLRTHARPD